MTSCPRIAQLSVYGIGLRSHTQVASQMFQSLGAAGINVEMINTSEICVSVVVDAKQGAKGLTALESARSAGRQAVVDLLDQTHAVPH